MNIIEELYNGNINPQSKCFDQNSEYGKLIKIICDHENKLTAYLNAVSDEKEGQQLLSQLITAQNEMSCINEFEWFEEGFKLGARLMLDTFIIERYSPI